jgi:phosphoribosylformimino-5-aminoimidazole carboxamide ribonucleotide (ProFAR) isomerase
MKNETLNELRRILVNNIKEEGKLKGQDFKQFTNLLDELLEIVNGEVEKGKTFDDMRRTVVEFFTKKKEEVTI